MLMRFTADIVLVSNERDRTRLVSMGIEANRVVVMHPSPDPDALPDENRTIIGAVGKANDRFDAVFMGRLHVQKGIIELVDIWRLVCDRSPGARLAVLGVGELEKKVRAKITAEKLDSNIALLGYLDADQKGAVLRASRIFVHPALHESGAIAPIEGMSWGLPCVMFDIPELACEYPKGGIKVPIGNLRAFADAILDILNRDDVYTRLRSEALELAKSRDWRIQSLHLFSKIRSLRIKYQ